MARNPRNDRIDTAKTHHGDHRNMAMLGQRRPKDAGWVAWNGDVKLKRNEGRIELVYGGIDMQQEGRYGTQTPVSQDHIEAVCPRLVK